ncbi:MAG: Ala-tRNA(Pro) hydrolase [Gammaproteobacteria bacterium]|nr:Ala-tRNA(Pro) hydrolase [Gammaproteobacteria bacterium]|tara:strand:+ start:3666 stop:4373 length:708 start_codon:yes stop_codon:yes gene_type:complete
MTRRLYEEDAYRRGCEATVLAADEAGVVLDQTVFYAMGGGQPGDTGVLRWGDGAELVVVDTRKGDGDAIVHVAAEGSPLPPPGTTVQAVIDWDRRHRHMRMHTCLHLLCAVVGAPVTGGNLTAEKGRLDFDLPESTVDKASLTEALNALIARDSETAVQWITDEELDARPELVKTLSVAPPRGAGRVRLLSIPDVDLQPCGGTHVARTGEIGRVRVTKIEKKSRLNRRIAVELED